MMVPLEIGLEETHTVKGNNRALQFDDQMRDATRDRLRV